jgi:hypothetical protein
MDHIKTQPNQKETKYEQERDREGQFGESHRKCKKENNVDEGGEIFTNIRDRHNLSNGERGMNGRKKEENI